MGSVLTCNFVTRHSWTIWNDPNSHLLAGKAKEKQTHIILQTSFTTIKTYSWKMYWREANTETSFWFKHALEELKCL